VTLTASTRALIFGTANSWSLAQQPGHSREGRDCAVKLEIQGDGKNGYHLVMAPEGFFTADSWHQSLDEAFASAHELFDVSAHQWAESTAQKSPNKSFERTREG
jgi:hypothetical protein